MVSRIDIGPEGGPFVELDESTGDFIIRVPNDSVDFDVSDLENIGALNATSATIDGNSSPFATDPHDNTQHSETYATTTEVDTKADDPHGNAAHDPNMVESGDYPDLQIDGITVDSTDTINFIPE